LLPFPTGGAVDIVARAMAAKMSEDLGKPFISENQSGGEPLVRRVAQVHLQADGRRYGIKRRKPRDTEGPKPGYGQKVPYGVKI
jgi:hypothetical protein